MHEMTCEEEKGLERIKGWERKDEEKRGKERAWENGVWRERSKR